MTRPRGRPPIPDEVRARVRQLDTAGQNHSQIARETGISRRSVIRFLMMDRAKSRQPKKTRMQGP